MIDTGAQTCHGSKGEEPVGVNGSAGSVNPSCATVTVTRPDIFVPQGLAPRDWYYPQTAGTWYCHEMSGSVCQDQTRIQCDSSVPLQANETHPGGCVSTKAPPLYFDLQGFVSDNLVVTPVPERHSRLFRTHHSATEQHPAQRCCGPVAILVPSRAVPIGGW